jgi:hypothetical protein
MTLTADAQRIAPTGEVADVEFVNFREKGAANTSKAKLSAFKRAEHGPQKVEYDYYDFGPLLSHNAAINIVIGERGVGKSYGAKRHVIKKWIKTGELFIYLRRYQEELIARDTFFDDIHHEFPEYEFRANGNTFEGKKLEEKKWRIMGYAIALSTSQKNKSQAYPLVKTIIFEEFILEKGFVRYMPNEVNAFLGFYSTVDRGQDKTKVLMLANAVSEMNPYSLTWEFKPNPNKPITTYQDNFIAVDFPKSEEYTKQFLTTRFGKFIEQTEYAKYAVHNEFADTRTEFVRPKDPKARFLYNLQTRHGWVSVWRTLTPLEYYVSRTLPPNSLSFTMMPEKLKPGMALLLYNDDDIKRLRLMYRTDRMRFDSSQAENIFLDLFTKKQ